MKKIGKTTMSDVSIKDVNAFWRVCSEVVFMIGRWNIHDRPFYDTNRPDYTFITCSTYKNIICSTVVESLHRQKRTSEQWYYHLIEHPDQHQGCPWEDMTASDLCWTAIRHPQFAHKCTWDEISDNCWIGVMSCQPQFQVKKIGTVLPYLDSNRNFDMQEFVKTLTYKDYVL
jgi:hypothetical protein